MRITEQKLQSDRLLRILATCLLIVTFGAATGWAVTQGVLIKSFLVGILALLVLFLLSQDRAIKAFSLQKGLLYLTIVAGFIGSAFLTIPVGPIHIFPYRVLLPLLWLIFAMGILLQGRVDLSHIKVKRYLQFLALWLLYAVLSLAWAASKGDAIRDIIFLFMAVSVIFFMVYYFSNIRDLKRFYYLCLLILGALIPIGLWENLTGHHLSGSGLIGASRANIFTPSTVFGNRPQEINLR